MSDLFGDLEDCRPVVKTTSRTLPRYDFKVGLSPLVVFVVWILEVGPMQDEGDSLANIIDVSVETYAL